MKAWAAFAASCGGNCHFGSRGAGPGCRGKGQWSASNCSARAQEEVNGRELLVLNYLVEKLTQNWKQMHLE